MKANRLFWAIALILGVTFGSCTKEQSELKLSDVAGSATIYGQVKYNQGIKVVGSTVYNDYLEVLSGVEVYVDLNLGDYKSGSSGVERYSTVTDADGNYSIKIPVGQTAISNDVYVAPFTGVYGEYVNGSYCQYDDAIYQSISPESFSVSNGDSKLININVSATPVFATESVDRPVKVLGTVDVDIEKREYYDGTTDIFNISKSTAALASGVVIVEVSNTTGSDDRTIEYSLNVTEGEFSGTIYFYSSWSYDDVMVSLTMEDVVVSEDDDDGKFVHYYVEKGETTSKSQYIAGTYSLVSGRDENLQSSATQECVCEFSKIYVEFTPASITGIRGIEYGSADYEYYNPMSWF